MARTKLIDPRRTVLVAVLAAAGLLATTACSRLADTVPATSGDPSHSPVAMRLDKPEKLLGSWNESVDRRLRKPAMEDTDGFRKLLKGEPTSAVGTAYTPVEEQYSRELGVHRPGDNRVILVNGVSGTVTAPDAALSHVFAARPAITDVVPVPPGPLGGVAGCGSTTCSGRFGQSSNTGHPDPWHRRVLDHHPPIRPQVRDGRSEQAPAAPIPSNNSPSSSAGTAKIGKAITRPRDESPGSKARHLRKIRTRASR